MFPLMMKLKKMRKLMLVIRKKGGKSVELLVDGGQLIDELFECDGNDA